MDNLEAWVTVGVVVGTAVSTLATKLIDRYFGLMTRVARIEKMQDGMNRCLCNTFPIYKRNWIKWFNSGAGKGGSAK